QVAATGEALMQSQRLAKSVSQALVGAPSAFPEVRESAQVLARNVRALSAGSVTANIESVAETMRPDVDALLPSIDRAERNAQAILAQQEVLTQVGQSLRNINRQSSDLLEVAEAITA